MSFLVIIFCLAIQWLSNISGVQYQWRWESKYYSWVQKHFLSLTRGHDFFTLLILILPIVVVACLLFTIVYHTTGQIGYRILSLALLWYCMDVVYLRIIPTGSEDALFLKSYQTIFAILFWYFVFGPVGLVLYVSMSGLCVCLRTQASASTATYFEKALGVLDWVPIRILGLTFALAGNFGAFFKPWLTLLPKGISTDQKSVVELGRAALTGESSGSLKQVVALIIRVLVVWLVIIMLITLGFWLG